MAGRPSFQNEKPKERINITLDVPTGDGVQSIELPFRMLVLGDFLGREDDSEVADREVISINKDNFADVMRSSNLNLDLVVEDKLSEEGGDLSVHLDIEGMSSFEPDEIVKQIPELSRLMAARNLLHDLRNRLITVKDFRKQLESVIKDDELRAKLLTELQDVVSSDESDAGSDDES